MAGQGEGAGAVAGKKQLFRVTLPLVQYAALAVLLPASGAVARENMACAGLASLYIVLMARFVLPPVTASAPKSAFAGSKVLKVYIKVAAWVGVYLPLAYAAAPTVLSRLKGTPAVDASVLLQQLHAEKELAVAAVPHVFLLCCQIVTERLTFQSDYISLPVRALVPVLYNSIRLVSIWEWVEAVFYHYSTSASSTWPLFLSRSLAVANLILWNYNLFGFLIPMFIPICFKSYFEHQKAWKDQQDPQKQD